MKALKHTYLKTLKPQIWKNGNFKGGWYLKTNENFIPFSNNVIFRKPRGTDLVTASELIPGFCRSKSNVPTPGSLRTVKSPTAGIVPGIKSPPLARTPPPPTTGLTLIGALCGTREGLAALVTFRQRLTNSQYASSVHMCSKIVWATRRWRMPPGWDDLFSYLCD